MQKVAVVATIAQPGFAGITRERRLVVSSDRLALTVILITFSGIDKDRTISYICICGKVEQ
jgi:hypothetical protein